MTSGISLALPKEIGDQVILGVRVGNIVSLGEASTLGRVRQLRVVTQIPKHLLGMPSKLTEPLARRETILSERKPFRITLCKEDTSANWQETIVLSLFAWADPR